MLKRLLDWLDERAGHREALGRWLDHPLVGGARWAYVLGTLVGIDFAILAVTGLALMTVYSPSPLTAWGSVHYLSVSLPGGWLLRGMHYFAANTMIVLLGAHLAQVVMTGAYGKPRELEWWLLLGMLGLVMPAMITGGLLPWDQFGYWARKVEAGIAGMAPGAGPFVQEMIQGGPQLGSLGLTRAYAVHVAVLPAAMLLVLWLRHALAKKQGWAPVAAGAPSAPYYRQLSRNIVGGILLLAAVFYMAWRAHGAPLDAPADATSNYPARPEWFLLPMFQLRKYFHGAGEFYGTSFIPAAAGLYLFALPLLDKRPGAGLRARIGPLVPAALVGLGAVLLSMAALRKDAGDAKYQKERQQADARAVYAIELAKAGIPSQGPVYMMHNDPELRGHDLFEKSCASCHVLGDLGDKKKANATVLDGWGTEDWIAKMIHDPDADDHFGKTPYKGEMPPVDVPSKDVPKPMLKNPDEVRAAALFLALQGDEPGEPPRKVDEAARKKGESIVTEQCTTCHLWKGNGDDDGNGKAPEFFHYGSIAWVRTQVANPSSKDTYREDALDEKLKGHMPRFDGDLTPADVDLVARWTRAHARGVPLAAPKTDASAPPASAHGGSAASTAPGAPSGSSSARKNKGKEKDKE